MAEKTAKYKSGETPKKGDSVLGAIDNAPARGRVLHFDSKTGKVRIERRGAARRDSVSNQYTHGQLEHVDAPAADFELIYRKEA